MPPRTRSTTPTAPAGRRPKVAGLRAPGRRGVSGGTAPVGDEVTTPESPETLETPQTPEAPQPVAETPATSETPEVADAPSSDDATSADPAAADGPTDDTAAAAPRPTPKRRSGRTMTPAPAPEPETRRGGTAVLERPVRSRTAAAAEPVPSRVARITGALTRPVAALGANPRRLIAVLLVVLVLSLGLGTWAFLAARADRAEGSSYANAAVVDVGGTAEVVGQTRQAMEQVLSYDFTKLDDSVNAAKTQATGTFASEYLSVFEQTIRKPATDQRLRQTATVLNIGVQQLSSDRATLMALVQFTAERTTNGQTTNAPGLLTVQVVKEDGRWKISDLKPV